MLPELLPAVIPSRAGIYKAHLSRDAPGTIAPSRHRPAAQPAPKQRNYNLLRTFERVIQPDVQQTVTLAVKQLKPVRQVMKMASAASGYNFC